MLIKNLLLLLGPEWLAYKLGPFEWKELLIWLLVIGALINTILM